jgi:hypothetical protein
MALETAVNATKDVINKTTKVADTAIKKAWSIMEAATEKRPPSEYLGQPAVKSIQGQNQG